MIDKLGIVKDIPGPIYYTLNKIIFQRRNKVYILTEDLHAIPFYLSEERAIPEYIETELLGIRTSDSLLIFRDKEDCTVVPLPLTGRKQIKMIHANGVVLRHEQESTWVIKNINFNGDTVWQVDYAEPFYASKGSKEILTIHSYATVNPFIIGYRLTDGSKLWQVKLKDLVPWERVEVFANRILHFENKLFFCCQSDSNRLTFCLDEASGKELERFDKVGSYQKRFGTNIYSVTGLRSVAEINIDSMEVKHWDFSEVLSAAGLEINLSRFIVTDDGLLYFTDGYLMPKSRFGIIDINKKALLHIEEVHNPESNRIESLEKYSNKVYIHTSDQCLHVYKVNNKE